MSKSTSRRVFLRKTALVTSGLALLPSTSLLHAMTPKKCPFDGYLPSELWNNDLRKTYNNVPQVRISGTIYDALGLLPKPDTVIEMWHLSPGSDQYSHRGKTLTDSYGQYSFITDFPSNEEGRAARLYFKLGSANSGYFTELILNELGGHISGTHWEQNRVLGSKMFPGLKMEGDHFNVTFNMTL